ncbi:MAG TPA: hypothetical protein PKG52_06435 [bacterium]|nr:hypothetical protein [bacterium]HPS30700.1 hypothetical protein [bacterium]
MFRVLLIASFLLFSLPVFSQENGDKEENASTDQTTDEAVNETPAEPETQSEPVTEPAPAPEQKQEVAAEPEAEPEPEKEAKVEAAPVPALKIKEGKPSKFFELYGYFAFANKLTSNMILNGNNPYLSSTKVVGLDESNGVYTAKSSSKEDILSWAWLKLHLEPVIDIAETLEIHTKMSIFGNTVMGADNFEADTRNNGLLRDAQLANSANIIFEGLWASVDTPIGELKAGRMPFNWGLGLLYNDGNEINDQSTGDYMDRIQLTIPVGGFKIIPAFDFASSGVLEKFHDYLIDSSQKDDGYNVSAMFMMNEDDPELLENKLLNEQTVAEFGAMVMFSWKDKGSMIWDETNKVSLPITDNNYNSENTYALVNQNAKLWKFDGWLKLHHKNFSLSAELAFLYGSIGQMIVDKDEKSVKTESVGVAVELEYRAIPKKFHLSLLTGVASPDDADFVQGDSWNNPGNSINSDSANLDTKVQNFRFNKDYKFNSTLWNEFLGRFTAGYYASLFGTYYILDELKIDLGATYTMALYANNSIGGNGLPVSFEPFISIDYANKSGLRGGVKYQLGVPLSGLDGLNSDGDVVNTELYHFLNVYLGIVF